MEISSDYPAPVTATLERVEIAYMGVLDGGTARLITGDSSVAVSALTPFGRQLLAYVRHAEAS